MNNKYKILMIEDEQNISTFVKTAMEANDYHVLLASTCQQGVMMFSSHMPDLVILDLGLPDRDGLEFISAVRESSAVPIIVLSARTMESDKVAALDMGANDYVTKPFGIAELLTYSAVIRSIWGSMDTGSIKKLQVNMANIRKKLGCTPGDNRYFINELGVGYRMLDEQ